MQRFGMNFSRQPVAILLFNYYSLAEMIFFCADHPTFWKKSRMRFEDANLYHRSYYSK